MFTEWTSTITHYGYSIIVAGHNIHVNQHKLKYVKIMHSSHTLHMSTINTDNMHAIHATLHIMLLFTTTH